LYISGIAQKHVHFLVFFEVNVKFGQISEQRHVEEMWMNNIMKRRLFTVAPFPWFSDVRGHKKLVTETALFSVLFLSPISENCKSVIAII